MGSKVSFHGKVDIKTLGGDYDGLAWLSSGFVVGSPG